MIVAGMGCSSQASLAELRGVLAQVTAGRALGAIACLDARKAQIGALAQELGLPLVTVRRADLQGVDTPSRSDRIAAEFGTGSVAEACALLVAGQGARIIKARQVSATAQATCALAEGIGQ